MDKDKDLQQEYNTDKAVKAQKRYCEEHGLPHFAPLDGWCWSCRRSIYEKLEYKRSNGESYYTGISVEVAGRGLITGCPHCNKSFCD